MGQQCCHLQPLLPRHAQPVSSHNVFSEAWRGTDSESPCAASPSNQQGESWEISRSDLEFIKVIGRDYSGTSQEGQTWSGKLRKSVDVEIKTVDMKKEDANEYMEIVKLLRGLHHPNLLNLLGVCAEGRQVHVVSEASFSVPNLQFWLSRGRQVCLPLHLHVLSQVASGMAYLEEHDLLYFDLAAREILMTRDLVCKIQVSSSVKTPQHVTPGDFPMHFAAMVPELSSRGDVTIKTCVWIFGMFMVEVMKGSHEHMTTRDKVEQFKKGDGLPAPANCPKELHKLMKQCWIPSPEKRPSFAFLRDSLQDAAAGYTEEDARMCLQDSPIF